MVGSPRQWQDYSSEVRVIKSPTLRYTLIVCSSLFLALGFIGIFIPGLPTTPFVLLAAGCYARSSPRFYNWLMNHHIFGPPLRQWIEYRCIPKRAKILALSMMTLTFVPTILLFVPMVPVKILLAIIGLSVAIFILRAPSVPGVRRRSAEQSSKDPSLDIR
ncbi:MAG: YbaN family protein [Oligoflexus sp.]|jgi:uncharacterized membrane protein YbaN (DUF454 family)